MDTVEEESNSADALSGPASDPWREDARDHQNHTHRPPGCREGESAAGRGGIPHTLGPEGEFVPINQSAAAAAAAAANPFLDRYPQPLATISNRELELQRLLAEERIRSEQRKKNYTALRGEHLKVQRDFLGLQSEVKQLLEETKLIREQKESLISDLHRQVDQKEKAAELLRKECEARDPAILKEQFSLELRAPLEASERERQKLLIEREKLSSEVRLLSQRIEQLDKDRTDGLERMKLLFEAEMAAVRREKEEIHRKLLEAQQAPDIQKLLGLSQENASLSVKMKQFQAELENAEGAYRRLESRLSGALADQERREDLHRKSLEAVRSQLEAAEEESHKLRAQIRSAERDKADLSSELAVAHKQLSESKKAVQETHNELGGEQDSLRAQIRSLRQELTLERQKIDKGEERWKEKLSEADKTIKTLKDEETRQLGQLERELESIRSRAAETREDLERSQQENAHHKRELERNSAEALQLEREIMTLRVKLEATSSLETEHEKLRRQHVGLHDELHRVREELAEASATNRDLSRTRDRLQEEATRVRGEMNDAEHSLVELKGTMERSLTRLRLAHEDERGQWMSRIAELEQSLLKRTLEMDHLKRTNNYLHGRSSHGLVSGQGKTRMSRSRPDLTISGGGGGNCPNESAVARDRELKKQLKDLKRATISSLLNCSLLNSAEEDVHGKNNSSKSIHRQKDTDEGDTAK